MMQNSVVFPRELYPFSLRTLLNKYDYTLLTTFRQTCDRFTDEGFEIETSNILKISVGYLSVDFNKVQKLPEEFYWVK